MGTLEAIATCLLLADIVLLPWTIEIPGKLIGLTWRDVGQSVWGVLACAVAMAGSVWALGTKLPPSWPHWAYLAVQVPFGIAVYGFLVHFFHLAPYQELWNIMVQQRKATFGPPVVPTTVHDSIGFE